MLLFKFVLKPINPATDRPRYQVQDGSWPNHKNNKTESDLHTMKQVLYDTGNLTVASWLLQRALKFKPPI